MIRSASSRHRLLERSLQHLAGAVQHALFSDNLSRRPGYLQARDARVKVIGVVALLICVGLAQRLSVIAAVYAFVLLLAWTSAISPLQLIRRVWLFMPFFTIPIALPALFLTPGPALIRMPFGLSLTETGLTGALFLLLRVSASVTLTLLLAYTTPWNTVLNALSSLRMPSTLGLLLGMTYRYIFLLLRTAIDLLTSRQSRVVGRVAAAEQRRLVAASAGTLLEKSLALSDEVRMAMESRGFRLAGPRAAQSRLRPADWVLLIGLLLFAAAFSWLGRSAS